MSSHEVKADEKMEINVPVHMSGESTGVKNEAGVLEVASHTLRIRCLPKDLPAFIDVDVTELHVGQTIHISELKPIAGVVFLGDKGQPVVSCVQPSRRLSRRSSKPPCRSRACPSRGCRRRCGGRRSRRHPGRGGCPRRRSRPGPNPASRLPPVPPRVRRQGCRAGHSGAGARPGARRGAKPGVPAAGADRKAAPGRK